MDPMEEQKHSVNDSEMSNPSILSVLVIFYDIYFNVYFALYVFYDWMENRQTNKQKKKKKNILPRVSKHTIQASATEGKCRKYCCVFLNL